MPFLIIDDQSAPPPPGDAILEDDFSGAIASINGRSPNIVNDPGNTWAVVNGTILLSGSGSALLPSLGDPATLIDLELANGFYVELEGQLSSGAYLGVNVNADSYNNSWEFGVYGGGTALEAYYNIGGGYSFAGTFSITSPADTPFTIRIEVTITGFDVYFNGDYLGNVLRSAGGSGFDADTLVGFLGALGAGSVSNFEAGTL